jgi:mRNA deadenylase 3'-5' endonuclease subunit Ccr4
MSNPSHRLITYNVLSSHLSEADYFKSCDPQNLNPELRLQKLLKKLTPEIEKKAIICLQEISTLWAGELHRFFAENNYYFITGLYGKPHNGYMGVGVAVPINSYSILDVKIERLTDGRDWAGLDQFEVKIRNFWQKINYFFNVKRTVQHPQYYAQTRLNQFIFITLKDKASQNKFSVANYHMPCIFFVPQVMTIHCAMIAQKIQQLAQENEFILAGDFNIRPNSPQYKLLTTGKIEPSNSNYPLLLKNDPWQPDLQFPLKSAYFEAMGKEPDFTNYAKVKDKTPFIDTLDYIWLSPNWQVKEVLPLPNKQEINSFLPNDLEPSDHILLGGEFILV